MDEIVRDFIAPYRLPGECDDCAIEAAALATGYPDNDIREGCGDKGCRFYDELWDEAL